MRYLDTGTRDPAQTLGQWMADVDRGGEITEVRWQAGFFTADALGHLAATLERLRRYGGQVRAVVGSNDGDTLGRDVERLADLLGVPRPGVRLGVVSYTGAFFHPKTYHVTRADGSEAAYVGSANLTAAGVGGLHVEAGLVLDTRSGDAAAVLAAIRTGVDSWFADPGRPGLTVVTDADVIARLLAAGVLAESRGSAARRENGNDAEVAGGAEVARGPRIRVLVPVPPWGTTDVRLGQRDAAPPSTDDGIGDEGDEASESDASAVAWDLVWRSGELSERDLNVPTGATTKRTGSIGLGRGDWGEMRDHRHYFRDEVFAALAWRRNLRTPTTELATAQFEVWIDQRMAGETALTIRHNTDTSSRTYEQNNHMTHLRWGEAKAWVADPALLHGTLRLYRERDPQSAPKFRIAIDRARA